MPDTNSFSDHIEFLRDEIDKAISKIPINGSLKYLYDPIQYVISGKGKRLRPILAHLSGQAHNADPSALMKVSLAIELLHNFSLVNDDNETENDASDDVAAGAFTIGVNLGFGF